MGTMSPEEITRQTQQIGELYRAYLEKLAGLQKQQSEILREFGELLKTKKIEEIKKLIATL